MTPAERYERARIALGDRVICQRCGATIETYGFDTCTAALDERCEGFDTVEAAAFGIVRTGEPRQ